MPSATAAPPATPSAPPSVKSFCTSITSSARVMGPPSVVGEIVAAAVGGRDDRVERGAGAAADTFTGRVDREDERHAVGRVEVAREGVRRLDHAGLREDLTPGDGVGTGEPVGQ